MSAINIVKYYFHKTMVPKGPEKLAQYIRLAYQTAREQELYPKEVLIRSFVHDTTTINGQRVKDPKGDHVTFSYKTVDYQGSETHVACHGYVVNTETLEFKEATFTPEKSDSIKKKNGQPV